MGVITAVEPLTDVQTWPRGSGLEILLIVSGAILRGPRRALGRRDDHRAHRRQRPGLRRAGPLGGRQAPARPDPGRHLDHRRGDLLVAGVLVVQRVGVPLGGLVAPAAVAGVALGFGAQRLVQDVLSGFFVITQHQYGYGDVVRLSVPGTGAPVQGTVEDVTLRVTQLARSTARSYHAQRPDRAGDQPLPRLGPRRDRRAGPSTAEVSTVRRSCRRSAPRRTPTTSCGRCCSTRPP